MSVREKKRHGRSWGENCHATFYMKKLSVLKPSGNEVYYIEWYLPVLLGNRVVNFGARNFLD